MANPEIDLAFLAGQQTRILHELAEMRLEHRKAREEARDDIAVLTTMLVRLDHAIRTQQDINAGRRVDSADEVMKRLASIDDRLYGIFFTDDKKKDAS
jgi:hypothetical protein